MRADMINSREKKGELEVAELKSRDVSETFGIAIDRMFSFVQYYSIGNSMSHRCIV